MKTPTLTLPFPHFTRVAAQHGEDPLCDSFIIPSASSLAGWPLRVVRERDESIILDILAAFERLSAR